MIEKAAAGLQAPLQGVRRFAALSGPFDPSAAFSAVPGIARDDPDAMVAVAAYLAQACDTTYGGDTSTWLMHGSERKWELEAMATKGQLSEAVARRREAPVDQATLDLLDALLGTGSFGTSEVRATMAAGGPRAELERVAVALDRAGSVAPAYGQLDAVNALIGRLDAEARDGVLLAKGFFGREPERSTITHWLARPTSSPPVMALSITGLPGIGKSTLLDEAVRLGGAADPPWLVVRFDFDRAGLDVQDQIGLSIELARQLATQLTDQATILRRARLEAAGSRPSESYDIKGAARERTPLALAATIGSVVRASGRPMLVILDTLEVLRGRAETHPERLFQWLDELMLRGVGPMSVLGAGRGDLGITPSRIGQRIELQGLDDADADHLLERLQVPGSSFGTIREIAQGNPLVLRLAARTVLDAGPEALESARGRKGLAAAFLYRFLLSRIGDPTLRRLADPGLIVRRVNAGVIGEVLGPQLGLGRIEPVAAEALFQKLATHHWLVETDPTAPGFVKHRADMRAVLLRLLYEKAPVRCWRIDRAAQAWFAKRSEPWCAVEAAYHRLQMMRRDDATPTIDPSVLPLFDEDMIAELPIVAQDVARRGRGERSTKFRGAAVEQGGPIEAGAADELLAMIDRGDWQEGRFVYDRTFAAGMFDPRSRDADVARTYLWRSGRWRAAKRLFDERERLGADEAVDDSSPQLAAARLEMQAELRFRGVVDELRRAPEAAMRAQDLAARGVRDELSSGALGFAMRRAGVESRTRTWRGFDSVAAAYATWARDLAPYDDASDAIRTAQAQLTSWLDPGSTAADGTEPSTARLLAVLSPYAATGASLISVRAGAPTKQATVDRLSRHALEVSGRLALLGGLPPAGVGPWRPIPSSVPSDALVMITALGLFAEWAGAAAFLLRDPDLGLIARSAERWRRTMAGRWSYELAPRAMGWKRPLDVSISDRIAALEASDDPVAKSHDQLAAWAGEDDPGGERLSRDIERRFDRTLRTASEAAASEAAESGAQGTGPRAVEAAVALMRRNVPSAFVPPLAILTSRNQLQ